MTYVVPRGCIKTGSKRVFSSGIGGGWDARDGSGDESCDLLFLGAPQDVVQIDKVILLMDEILHQLIWKITNYLQGVIHPRWCRISSINSRYCTMYIHIIYTYVPNRALRITSDPLIGRSDP